MAVGVRLSAVCIGAFVGIAGLSASANELTVAVSGLRSLEGVVHIAVYDREDAFPSRQALAGTAVEPAGDGVLAVFSDLPEGRYAVAVFHDENANGRFDRGPFGLPREGFGFSNDAPVLFGPPSFRQAAVALPEEGKTINVRMRY